MHSTAFKSPSVPVTKISGISAFSFMISVRASIPVQSPMRKSDRATSTGWEFRTSTKAARVETVLISSRKSDFSSARRVKTRSSGLSSATKSFNTSVTTAVDEASAELIEDRILGRQKCRSGWLLVHYQPVQAQLADHLLKLGEVYGLLNVAVYAQLVAGHHIPLLVGGGQQNDGNGPGGGILFQLLEHLQTVDFRQLEIQKNQARVSGPLLSAVRASRK